MARTEVFHMRTLMRTSLAFFALTAISAGAALAGQVPPGLKLAMVNFKAAKSYHMSFVGGGTKIEIDVVQPNRTHSFVNGTLETIQIGPMTYTRLNGQWLKVSQPGADPADIAKDMANVKVDDPSVTYSDRGMTTVGGRVYHRYTYVTSEQPGQTIAVDVGIDNEIYRITATGANGAAVLFSKYNAPLTITAPI